MPNFQAVVSQFFEWQTSLVVRCPLPFLVLPPSLTLALCWLSFSDLHLNISNDTLRVFLPDDIQALNDLNELLRLFPPRDALRDSYSIFGTSFVYTIYEADENALEPAAILRMAQLHSKVRTIKAGSTKMESVCLKSQLTGACSLHPFAFALEDSDPVLSAQFLLRFPLLIISNFTIDNAVIFGGVSVLNRTRDRHGNAAIDRARAVRMIYTLENGPRSDEWIDAFLEEAPSFRYPNATVHFTSSRSLAKEMERNGHLLIPWMPWMSLVLVFFCMLVCSSRNPVRSQPLVGFFAMLNATLATIASTALLLYLQYPFLPLVFIMPFLVISIGVDNMFLMLKSWRMGTAVQLEERFIEALTESAASLFLTSLTDGLSFSIGSISEFYAVRVFSTYCAMAILFMFFYQITFLNSLMILCCRREFANRHSLLCYRVKPKSDGSLPPPSTFLPLPIRLARLLNLRSSRVVVLLLYLLYLVFSINAALSLPLGLDLKLLVPDDSYVSAELRAQERLFADYGAFCFGVLRTEKTDLADPAQRRNLLRLYNNMTRSPLASAAEFWLAAFEEAGGAGRHFSSRRFTDAVLAFLEKPENGKYKNDIRKYASLKTFARFSPAGRIMAMKMILRVRKVDPANDEPRARFLRDALAAAEADGFVYDTSFLLVDQQFSTIKDVISNVITAVVTMLAICVLLVPRIASSLCVSLAILSVNIGVVGALAAVSTRLDIISMITIVMSVGFSVDYVVHTTFHFVTQKEERLERCLTTVFEPMLQSALSTAVGVALLAFVPSYIVRTFVFTVLFVVGIGLLHGLLFLPALLTTVVSRLLTLPEWLPSFCFRCTPASTSRLTAIVFHKPRLSFPADLLDTYNLHHTARIGCYRTPPSEIYDLPPKVNESSICSPTPSSSYDLPLPPLPPTPPCIEDPHEYDNIPYYHPIVKPRRTAPQKI